MKRVIASIMGVVVFLASVNLSIVSKAAGESGGRYSQDMYDGFELEWTNNGERDILLSASNISGTTSFLYDERDLLIEKTENDGNQIVFNYNDDAQILSVEDESHLVTYSYDEYNLLTSMTIDGVVYGCILDDMNSVAELTDSNGNTVVAYSYENGFVDGVYEIGVDGDMTDRSGDLEFVGNINKVTYCSYYYHENVGWYYCGRFYDAKENRFVDGLSLSFTAFMEAHYPVQLYAESTLAELTTEYYNYLINSSTIGSKVTYTGNWYTALEDKEVIARLIYGEAPYWLEDRHAVSWVLWSRRESTAENMGAGDLYNVATAAGQFATITGSSAETNMARNPETSTTAWKTSVRCASALFATQDKIGAYGSPASVLSKPSGYVGQLYFCSYDSFFYGANKAVDEDGVVKRGDYIVADIFIPWLGTFTTVAAAKAEYDALGAVDSDERPTNYISNRVNIYYNRIE